MNYVSFKYVIGKSLSHGKDVQSNFTGKFIVYQMN